MMPDTSFGPVGVETDRNRQLGGQNAWLGVGTRSLGWKAWLGVETRSWGLVNGQSRANKLKKHAEKRRKCT
jgi:hypothetical protein